MRFTALAGVGILVLIVFMYRIFMLHHEREISEILQWISSRILAGQIIPSYYYTLIFPDHHSYLGTSVLPNPGGLFPIEHVKYTVMIMEYIRGHWSGVVGSAPTVCWGEAWISMGWIGVVTVMFTVGLVIGCLERCFRVRNPRTILALVAWVYVVLYISKISGTGATLLLAIINPYYILLIMWVMLMSRLASNSGRENRKL
jgi:hypothetical protein